MRFALNRLDMSGPAAFAESAARVEQLGWHMGHHRDPVRAGRVVDFLDSNVADAFALHGNWEQIGAQLQALLGLDLPVSIVLPHPIIALDQPIDFIAECAHNLISEF